VNEDGLRAFTALVEHRHFGRAAESTFVAVSTLSRRLGALERELGVVLIERTSRVVRLSACGKLFLPHARRLLMEIERADRAAARIRAVTSSSASRADR
jgi:LysR family hydrogen peroxide-inducible transcriptional activator